MGGPELLVGLGCFLAGVIADRVCLRIKAHRRSLTWPKAEILGIATEDLQPGDAVFVEGTVTNAHGARIRRSIRVETKGGSPAGSSAELAAMRLSVDQCRHNWVNGGAFYVCTKCNAEANDLGEVVS